MLSAVSVNMNEDMNVPDVFVKALGNRSTTDTGWADTIAVVKTWLETGIVENDSSKIDLLAEPPLEELEVDFDDTASVYAMPATEHGAKSYAKMKDYNDGPPLLYKEFDIPILMSRSPTSDRCESIIKRLKDIMNYLLSYIESNEVNPCSMNGLKTVNMNLLSTFAIMLEIGLAHLYYRKGEDAANEFFQEWTKFITTVFMFGDGPQAYRGFIDLALQKGCSIGLKCHTLGILCKKLESMEQKSSTLLVPALALLISQATRQSHSLIGSSTDTNGGIDEPYKELRVVKEFYSSFTKTCSKSNDQDSKLLWDPKDDGYPLGCIIARHLPIRWRVSTALLWICSKAPLFLGGVKGRQNKEDDFHGVSRASVSSFIGRIITHLTYGWKYNYVDKSMTIYDDLPIATTLHSRLRRLIHESMAWFRIYQPEFWRNISNTNITCDGSEAVAGDLELGPLGMCSVVYASRVMEMSHTRDVDTIGAFPLLVSPLSSHTKVLILLRNLQALSIVTIAKIENRCYAADHTDMDQMVNATVLLAASLRPYFTDIKNQGTLDFGLYDLHVNLIKLVAQLCYIFSELKDEERSGLNWHREDFWLSRVYPDCIRTLAVLFQLIRDGDKRNLISKLLSHNVDPKLQTIKRQSVFLEILEAEASLSGRSEHFNSNLPKFLTDD